MRISIIVVLSVLLISTFYYTSAAITESKVIRLEKKLGVKMVFTAHPVHKPGVGKQIAEALKHTANAVGIPVSGNRYGTIGVTRQFPVLTYHSINDDIRGISSYFVSPREFEKQMKYLSEHKYTPILFDQLPQAGKYLKPVIITFDDGYKDNYVNAYPILKKYHMKAVVFLISKAINRPFYLNASDIKAMKDIISFQSHTMTHPHLTSLNERNLDYELGESKKSLEALTGTKMDVISYPYSDYNSNVIKEAAKFYKYGLLDYGGFANSGSGKYMIPRIAVKREYDISRFASLVATGK